MPNLLALKLNNDEIWVISLAIAIQPVKRWPDKIEVLFANRDDVYELVLNLSLSVPKNIQARKTLLNKIETARQNERSRQSGIG